MTKKQNRRFAKKRALRLKHGISDNHAFRDTMSASSRKYGGGLSR